MIYIKQELIHNDAEWFDWNKKMLNDNQCPIPLDKNEKTPPSYPCLVVYAEETKHNTYQGVHFEVSYKFIDESAFGK